MLTAIAATGPLDGIASTPARAAIATAIFTAPKDHAGGQSLYWSFYVYKDWIDYGIPPICTICRCM